MTVDRAQKAVDSKISIDNKIQRRNAAQSVDRQHMLSAD